MVGGVTYYSGENYFQCQKSVGVSEAEFERTRQSGRGADVWVAGSRVKLRADWEEVKVRVMYEGNRAKLEQNPKLAAKLTASKGPIVFNASSAFWCDWNGRIMTLLREELKPEGQRNEDVIARIRQQMLDLEANERRKRLGE